MRLHPSPAPSLKGRRSSQCMARVTSATSAV